MVVISLPRSFYGADVLCCPGDGFNLINEMKRLGSNQEKKR
jgi:hypothetical protein